MKTIQVSDEQYEALIEMQDELKTQDNRNTRDPIYIIMDKETFPTSYDYSDDYIWFNSYDSETIGDDEDLFEYLVDNCSEELIKSFNDYQDENNFLRDIENEESKKELKEWFLNELTYSEDISDITDLTVEHHIIKIYQFENESIQYKQGMPISFFEKDMIEHLSSNDYHYTNKAKTYACSLWRSRRMEKLREILLNMEFEK